MIANEAYIMFIHNRTFDWLQGKSEKESSLLIKAIKNVKKSRKQFKERGVEIEKQRQLILEEKSENKRMQKRVKKLEEYTNNILTGGMWQTEDQVDFHLNTDIKSQKDKIEVLKAQLNFRRFVLQRKISGEGFNNLQCDKNGG